MRVALFVLAFVRIAVAAPPDADAIGRITGLTPEVKNDVVRVAVPRSDLTVKADGVTLTPFQGLTSWAAFAPSADGTMVMGDLTLAEAEVDVALGAALDNGLAVTALHNHFLGDEPRVFFMHIAGHGGTDVLATAVRRTLDAVKAAPKLSVHAALPAPSSLDVPALVTVLGEPAQTKDGMAKFVFGKETDMHGTTAGAALGVNTWAAFAGLPADAVVDGDFAMLEDELQPVLKALHHEGLRVVAIHNHMTHEQPRILFLHFWGRGDAIALARGVKAGLAAQTH